MSRRHGLRILFFAILWAASAAIPITVVASRSSKRSALYKQELRFRCVDVRTWARLAHDRLLEEERPTRLSRIELLVEQAKVHLPWQRRCASSPLPPLRDEPTLDELREHLRRVIDQIPVADPVAARVEDTP